jgi:hypothetical protein
MNTKELCASIAKKVTKAAKERLWERASEIVEMLGKKDIRQGNDYTTVSYDLTVCINKRTLHIHKSSYRYGPDYLWIRIDGKQVFQVNERSARDFVEATGLNKVCMYRRDGGYPEYLEFKSYIDNGWEHLLDREHIQQLLHREQKVREVAKRMTAEKERAARPLTKDAQETAHAFNL